MITERKDKNVFTARNRQNPFAKRRRAQAEAEKAAAAVPASSPEPPAPKPVQMAAPFDRNPESEEYEQAPDISTYAAGGGVELPAAVETVPEEVQPELIDVAKPLLSSETQAKIDAVMNHAVPPVADKPSMLDTLIETMPSKQERATIAEPEMSPEDEPKRGRGRPRPQETIDRDNAVYALLVGADPDSGISKESIAAELDEKEQQVYSSLRQLTKEGRAATRYVKPHGYRWFAVQGD